MPPKPKFTREKITEAALNIIRTRGAESLTARELGKALGSSPCPIFTLFADMDEVKASAMRAARALYGEYIAKGLEAAPAFKGAGMQYIKFAMCEPKLFHLLFMSARDGTPVNILPEIDENYPEILLSACACYALSRDGAEKLYRHMWIYAHGIATLCATGTCTFTETEAGNMLTEICSALIKKIKEGV